VQGLVSRVLGPQYVNSFIFQVIPDVNGYDVYEISPTSNGTIIIRGNAGYVLSAGLNWYLKYTANCSFSWGRNGSGNQIRNLPLPSTGLPQPPSTIRMVSNLKYRYSYNVCTYGYTMAWWNFTLFEEEIDRLALWGINLPLAFQAQEYTADRFWRSVGLNETEIGAWFAGGAFLPWNRMGNMQGWGGPLNPIWHSNQKALQTQILTRMREFGMVPVLAGFAGHVPRALQLHYPNSSYTNSPDWCGFPPQYGSDSLLEPTDPLFLQIGTTFHKMMLEDWGDPTNQETPVFNADMYNEMEPNNGNLTYLTECNANTYQAMVNADPRSIYMMQAWLFHEDFWTFDRVQAYLAGVPNSSMIILDLNSEAGPVWNQYNSFFGHEWIWNSLITYGGRRGIYGDLNRLANQPYVDKNASATMVGVGFTPEATEMIPSQFDVTMEAGWRTEPVDPNLWFQQWGVRRYGNQSPSISQAQTILATAAYNSPIDTASFEIYPSIGDSMSHNTNATGILASLRLFVEAAENKEIDSTVGPFQYDLTDLHRQVLVNIWSDAHAVLGAVYDSIMLDKNPAFERKTSLGRAATIQLPSTYRELTPELQSKKEQYHNLFGSKLSSSLKEWQEANNDRKNSYIPQTNSMNNNIPIADASTVTALVNFCNTILTTLDNALSANINFLLGTWIADSVQWGSNDPDPTHTDLYVFNARNQITEWGPQAEINDYAAKNGWADLVKTYYLPRYSILFDAMIVSAQTGTPIDENALDANITNFQMNWSNITGERPATQPNGQDPVQLAADSLTTYATYNSGAYKVLYNTDVAVPPQSKVFIQVGKEGYAAVSADCPYLAMGDGSSLTNCENSCLNYNGCTAINYNSGGGSCVFRGCSDPLHPVLSPGYAGWITYGLNETAGPVLVQAWHTDIGVLSTLCTAAQGVCGGFNSNGVIYHDVSQTVAAPGINLYIMD